jgi:hypothetical protein
MHRTEFFILILRAQKTEARAGQPIRLVISVKPCPSRLSSSISA